MKQRQKIQTEAGDRGRDKEVYRDKDAATTMRERERERDKERSLWLSGRPKQTLGAMSPKGQFQSD